MSLERNGQVCEHVLDSCSYGKQEWEIWSINTIVYYIYLFMYVVGEKAFLYSQFSRQGKTQDNWKMYLLIVNIFKFIYFIFFSLYSLYFSLGSNNWTNQKYPS